MPFIFRFPSNSLGNIKVVNMDFTPSFLNTLCINSTKGGEGEKCKILNSKQKKTFRSQISKPLIWLGFESKLCSNCFPKISIFGREILTRSRIKLINKIFRAAHNFPDNKITITVSVEIWRNQFLGF